MRASPNTSIRGPVFFSPRVNRWLLLFGCFCVVIFFSDENNVQKSGNCAFLLNTGMDLLGNRGIIHVFSRETTLSLFHIFIVFCENEPPNAKRVLPLLTVLICEHNNRAIFKMCL